MEDFKYLNYYKNQEVTADVSYILHVTDQDFIPTLSSKFSLDELIRKYIKFAHLIIAYFKNKPIGLISYYANPIPKNSYLSLIAVKKDFRGKQVGKNLELKCLEFCKEINSSGMEVNMRKSNTRLLKSRLDMGYEIVKEYKLENSEELIVDLYFKF